MPFIGFCYPCQVLPLENLLFWTPLTSSSHLLHLSPTNLPVTCCHRGTQTSSIWRFAPAEILFFGLSLLGKRFFAFRFQNHPPTRNLASNLRVTWDLFKIGFGIGYGNTESEHWGEGKSCGRGAPRFRPSELQTTPPPGPGDAAAAAADARLPRTAGPPRYNNGPLLQRGGPPPARCPSFERRRPALLPFRLSGRLAAAGMTRREPPPLSVSPCRTCRAG